MDSSLSEEAARRPRTVFVSHSMKDREARPGRAADAVAKQRWRRLAHAQRVRSLVVDRLRESGRFEVWLDVDSLRPGCDWLSHINRWLGSCDVAVLFLSREALDSEWVRREVHILGWRRSFRSGLQVVPVLLDDLTADDLRAAGLWELEDVEWVQLSAADVPGGNPLVLTRRMAEALAGKVAAEVLARPHVCTSTPMEEWVEDVAAILAEATRSQVLRAARKLGISDRELAYFPDVEVTLAQHLLFLDLRTAYEALKVMARALPVARLHQLIELTLPIWVTPGAAHHLQSILAARNAPRIVAINGVDQVTAIDYIERATCLTVPLSQIAAATDVAGEGGEQEILPRYVLAIARRFNLPEEDVAAASRYLAQDGVDFFIVVGGEAVSTGALMLLREQFSSAVYVLLAGTEVDEGLLDPAVPMVHPLLAPDEETRALDTRKLVDNLREQR